jgi:hypothetical protein
MVTIGALFAVLRTTLITPASASNSSARFFILREMPISASSLFDTVNVSQIDRDGELSLGVDVRENAQPP